jgi:hypothetical protein
VEARHADLVVQVRDSKLGETSPILDASPADWRVFLAAVAKLPTPKLTHRVESLTAPGPVALRP